MLHPPRARRARPARRPLRPFFVIAAALVSALVPVRAQLPGAAGEVRLVVTVMDEKGRYLTGLDKSHFAVLEGKDERAITTFGSADVPASVGVLVDVSGSMGGRQSKSTRPALAQLFLGGHPDSQFFITEFNRQASLVADWTSDRERLAAALVQVGASLGEARAKGTTALYDACAAALDKLAEGRHAKRVLVVVSDGQDNFSRTRFKDLRRKVQESDVMIYCVGPLERFDPGTLDVGGQALLDELASISGGRAFFPQGSGEAMTAVARIAVELRHQYVVGFAPGDAAASSERKWRKVKIRLTPPPLKEASTRKEVKKLYVRSRDGYFFPRAGS